MIVTFKPDDGEGRVYDFHPEALMWPESEEIERLTGMPYQGEFQQAILQGSARARRALVFVFEKRAHPTLAWKTFTDFRADAITVEYDRKELSEFRQGIQSAAMTDEEREQVLAQLAVLEDGAPDAPKAPAVVEESTT